MTCGPGFSYNIKHLVASYISTLWSVACRFLCSVLHIVLNLSGLLTVTESTHLAQWWVYRRTDGDAGELRLLRMWFDLNGVKSSIF